MLKFYAVVVLTLVFIYAFSASYTSDSVDNISYVIALAVDVNEGEQNLQVTFEFMDTSAFSSEQSGDSKGAIIDTVTSTSINSAINLLNAYIGKEVNLSHCKVVVFSDKLAEKGISSEVSELMNNIQVRPSTNIIICKGNALEYIQNSNIMIGEFYNYLTTKECGNLAILGGLNPTISPSNSSGNPSNGSSDGSSSGSNKSSEGGSSEKSSENSSKENSESTEKPDNNNNLSQVVSGSAPILGERGTENIGLAVLKDGIYRGDLTAIDTLCHTLIKGEVNSFLLTINNTEIYKNYIDVSLYENNPPKITVNISENEPVINIKIKLVGRISNLKDGINYSDESTNLDLNEISDAVNRSLEGYIYDYLKKTSSEFKCDIDYFYNYAKRNFKTIYDWRNYDWGSKYEKSKFNVSVESQVYYSLLNSD